MKRGSLSFWPQGNIALDVPDRPEELAYGLQGRDNLGLHEGMLFLGRDLPMWMAQVRFPILMVWLGEETVSSVVEGRPGDTSMKRGHGIGVVEVNPGWRPYLRAGIPYTLVVP